MQKVTKQFISKYVKLYRLLLKSVRKNQGKGHIYSWLKVIQQEQHITLAFQNSQFQKIRKEHNKKLENWSDERLITPGNPRPNHSVVSCLLYTSRCV